MYMYIMLSSFAGASSRGINVIYTLNVLYNHKVSKCPWARHEFELLFPPKWQSCDAKPVIKMSVFICTIKVRYKG